MSTIEEITELGMTIWCQVFILHHCKKHTVHNSLCKKCDWWTKQGKRCKKRKTTEQVFAETLEYYLKKGDRNNPEYVKKANELAQLVAQRKIESEKEFA